MSDQALLIALENEEALLQFDSFSNADAIAVGMALYEKAKADALPIAIDVTRAGQQLFHLALPGATPDNDQWILRKNRVVNRFHMSSYHVGVSLRAMEKTLEEHFKLSEFDYAPCGGSFPIILKNTGVVGTVAVSGLTEENDHATVVEALRMYLLTK